MLEVSARKRFRSFYLNVTFTAGSEMVVVFGPSGAGKSQTLRAIAGLTRPDEGRIVLNGRTLFDSSAGTDLPVQARRVGYVPQQYALFPHITVAKNVAYGLHHLPAQRRREEVEKMLTLMRLSSQAACYPRELSGGQQQRVALARALVTRPDILLLDEPFSALDSGIRSTLQRELLVLQAHLGIPILLVTHDLAEAYAMGHQIIVLDDGTVLQGGDREEVLRKPRSPSVAQFMGMRNLFDGEVLSTDDESLYIRWNGRVIQAPPQPRKAGEQVTFGIRPEEVMFIRRDRPPRRGLQENILAGQVVGEISRGTEHLLFFHIDDMPDEKGYHLEVLLPHPVFERLGLAVGKQEQVSLKKGAIHVLPEVDVRWQRRAVTSPFVASARAPAKA
ncbi:MAG: ABC transporter ATP-binding protein [Chloroflexi bacterium]|nr:ABC transporter ATP-binding protein [Chloroflexota bacterium]